MTDGSHIRPESVQIINSCSLVLNCKMKKMENLIYVESGTPDIVKKVVNTAPSKICCRFHRCVCVLLISTFSKTTYLIIEETTLNLLVCNLQKVDSTKIKQQKTYRAPDFQKRPSKFG